VIEANKLTPSYATLVEALNRYRGKGHQHVTVEHVRKRPTALSKYDRAAMRISSLFRELARRIGLIYRVALPSEELF
jgi:hypothetical protein